jgi:hypothetical protein
VVDTTVLLFRVTCHYDCADEQKSIAEHFCGHRHDISSTRAASCNTTQPGRCLCLARVPCLIMMLSTNE